jgi:hypothetical protein
MSASTPSIVPPPGPPFVTHVDLPTYEKERVRIANVFWRPALKAAMSKEPQ